MGKREEAVRKWKDAIKAYEESDELVIYQALESLTFSFQVFEDNYRELVALITEVSFPGVDIQIWDTSNRDVQTKVMREHTRLLHNFLAAAKSLVDHTRVIVDELYTGMPFAEEYQKAVSEHFADNPLQRFIQDLRNYTQHYALPITTSTLSFDREAGLSSALGIDVTTLRRWHKWSKPAQRHIDTLSNSLNTLNLADAYFTLVTQFYRWLSDRQAELHRVQFETLRAKQQAVLDAQTRIDQRD